MQLYCSTRCVALLGGGLVVASYFITSFYTGNVYIQLCCGFGILYGIGCGIMWRFACNSIFRCFPCLISVVFVSSLSPSIVCVIRWFPQSKALLTGTMMSALGMGSIALSMTETLVCYGRLNNHSIEWILYCQFDPTLVLQSMQYINLSNVYNDPSCGYTLYPQLMDKIPTTFLLLAGICVFSTFCGYAFRALMFSSKYR